MIENGLFDALKAIMYFFLNPLFITSIIVVVILGYIRVKRERRSFRVRLLPGLTELRRILSESWLYALILSVVISGVGLLVDPGWLVLFCMVSLVAVLTFFYKIMSPIYFVAISFLVLFLVNRYADTFTYRGWSPQQVDLSGELALTVAVIGGLLLITEGLLISRFGARDVSPYLMETNRGLRAAVYKSKRLWLLPVLFLVPGDMITAYVPYWPQFMLGETSFSFIPVPVLIGFSQLSRSMYSDIVIPKIGRRISMLGIVVVIVGIASVWLPILSWTALIIGFVCRALISIVVAIQDPANSFAVSPRSTGVVIAGVLPDSPGEKMGLVPGECIRSVNGQEVHDEKELYDAIQINAAHCRLQVLGRDGEVRLMQQVIYRHDHHRLGLLVVR